MHKKLLNIRAEWVKLYVVPICICLLLSACSEVNLKKLSPNATIFAFGDSLTVGKGVNSSFSYPSILTQLSGYKVVNAGVSGETTSDGLIRLSRVLKQTQPELLILLEGGNDILRNIDSQETKNNLSKMISLAKKQGTPVVLVGVPEKNLFSSSAALYQQLANQHQLVFEGKIIADLLRNPILKSDSVHFNKDGYRILAENIFQLLKNNGAL